MRLFNEAYPQIFIPGISFAADMRTAAGHTILSAEPKAAYGGKLAQKFAHNVNRVGDKQWLKIDKQLPCRDAW